MQNNSEVSALAGIRSVASDVASYVSVGVIAENRTEFDHLNNNITAHYDYLSGKFVFEGLKVQEETDEGMKVLVKFKTLGESNSTVDAQLVSAVGEAMVETLKEIRGGFSERDGRLYYDGIEIVLNVSVNYQWGGSSREEGGADFFSGCNAITRYNNNGGGNCFGYL
ncbi:hypothetical protein [Thermococcus peptonophilus]|uniref:hypothetical protein n=1 Tax=Thermococcus peptonophilus TaxID=53952 RepID=UPI0006D1BCEB